MIYLYLSIPFLLLSVWWEDSGKIFISKLEWIESIETVDCSPMRTFLIWHLVEYLRTIELFIKKLPLGDVLFSHYISNFCFKPEKTAIYLISTVQLD